MKPIKLNILGGKVNLGGEVVPADPTENLRRAMVAQNNAMAKDKAAARLRAELEIKHPGGVYNTAQLGELFDVESFGAPFVVVTRKSDGARGSLEFCHSPRFYFNFIAH